jgi:hypothetical protein
MMMIMMMMMMMMMIIIIIIIIIMHVTILTNIRTLQYVFYMQHDTDAVAIKPNIRIPKSPKLV